MPFDRSAVRARCGLIAFVCVALPSSLVAQDPRVGLRGGWHDAQEAISNLELVSHTTRPARFFTAGNPGDFGTANSDMAFRGHQVFLGNFNGWQVFDISNIKRPTLVASLVCPGGQGDLSIHGNLLFMSVEETRGRVDCGTQGVADTVSAERFRGVRIFDISNVASPRQVAAVQTCRGSHTHTLVVDPKDKANVYVYVGGTAGVRSPRELSGCIGSSPEQNPNTALFRIEVIRVPLAAPQQAAVVSTPRIFANATTGAISGLWPGGAHGEGTQTTAATDQCHDITVFPELGLAAGACSGNGILLDISDVANPKRIAEVSDPNFAYWHSATFNNDGSKVLFTDEWGGGTAARCRETDKREWGANAIFTLSDRKLTHRSYFKLPAAQTAIENCVAHNGSMIPVPGRDIMVQAWYQGGLSIFDFTDASKPVEIAYFDRGPVDTTLTLGGFWSAYWYNGQIIASEIARGLDIFALKPSAHLSQNEIDAAQLIRVDHLNPQIQTKFVWPAHFSVARAYVDQLARNQGLSASRIADIRAQLDSAEKLSGTPQRTTLTRIAAAVDGDAQGSSDAARVRALADAVRKLAGR
jgi:hypothetical protein